MMLKPEYQQMIKAILDEWVPGSRTALFGSRATGTANKFSDVDLLIYAKQQISFRQMVLLFQVSWPFLILQY